MAGSWQTVLAHPSSPWVSPRALAVIDNVEPAHRQQRDTDLYVASEQPRRRHERTLGCPLLRLLPHSPYGSFTMERGDDIETTVLLALIGLMTGELVEWARRNGAAAMARRRELDQIRRRAELAAGGERPGRLIEMSAKELTEILDLKACRYVPTPIPEDLPVFTHTAIVVPGIESENAPQGAVALPVRAHGRDLGHFLLIFPTPLFGIGIPTDVKHAAVALADQLGIALLRYQRP
ncbi:MAG: hypothetical protein ACRD0W_20910 [Acidimicrobiales bacterium]